MIWFTSDTHFGHAGVIKHAKRPFADVQEMDAAMVDRWNAVVQSQDTIYHLGDFSFYRTRNDNEALLRRLHGQKHLVYGNHDHDQTRKAKGWASVAPYREIKVELSEILNGFTGPYQQHIVLFHYRMVVWNAAHYGAWALHGHSHGTLPVTLTAKTFDVGVDCWEYTPISLETVAREMAKRSFVSVDHHGRSREEA